MKRIYLVFLTLFSVLPINIMAEGTDVEEQLIIFRNTGAIDLLFTHEVDSITMTADAQIFYAKDTTLVIPFSELDSVAVGNRNVKEFKDGVHELTNEKDIPWLIRVAEGHLYYKQNTPADILPKIGEKLFFGECNDLLPYGLTASVVRVTQSNGEKDVEVEALELKDIFERFFYSGRMNIVQDNSQDNIRSMAKADMDQPFHQNENLSLGQCGEINVIGNTTFAGNFVVDVVRDYYKAHINAESEIGYEAKLISEDSGEIEKESPKITFVLPTVAGVICPKISLSLFAVLNAELALNFSMKRNFKFEFDWTRSNGNQTCQFLQPKGDKPKRNDDQAQADLTLNGELYLGARATLDLSLPGGRLGFRTRLNFGPSIEGTLGIGVLRKMRNYDVNLFSASTLNTQLKLQAEAVGVHRERFLIFGDEVESPLYSHDFVFLQHEINLFPEYKQSRAVAATQTRINEETHEELETNVTMATAIEEPPLVDKKTGFEIVDPKGEVVDSVFVGIIKKNPADINKPQTFDSKIKMSKGLKQSDMENYTMRPVFHYAGYTVSAAPVGVKKDVLIQPFTFCQDAASIAVLSSGPFIGSILIDEILYQHGAYMPVPLKDNLFKKTWNESIEDSSSE